LGDLEAPEPSEQPTLVEEVSDVTAVACGSNHSGFVSGGRLHTFGSNAQQQLGRDGAPSEAAPVLIRAEDGHCPAVLQADFGGYHSAAVTEGGALWTWGWGGSFWSGAGALGHGTSDARPVPTLVERFVEEGQEVRQVVCGFQHTLVLTDQGRLYSTGKGQYGRLGRSELRDELEFEDIEYFDSSNDSILNPVEATQIVKLGAGSNFSAAMSSHGELWIWGRNDYGQLGQGEQAMTSAESAARYPRMIRSLPLEGHRIVDFACGEHHVVALTSSGAIYEWGNRHWLEPHPVSLPSRYDAGLKNLSRVFAGDRVSFALTTDGRLYSWGLRLSGCLAHGPESPEQLFEPVLIAPETFAGQRVVDLAVGRGRCLAVTVE